MLKKGEKILLFATIAVGITDLCLANGVYLKKKGVVLRDMILSGIDKKTYRPLDEEAEEKTIPID